MQRKIVHLGRVRGGIQFENGTFENFETGRINVQLINGAYPIFIVNSKLANTCTIVLLMCLTKYCKVQFEIGTSNVVRELPDNSV